MQVKGCDHAGADHAVAQPHADELHVRLRGDRPQSRDAVARRELAAAVTLVVRLEREVAVVARVGKVTQERREVDDAVADPGPLTRSA